MHESGYQINVNGGNMWGVSGVTSFSSLRYVKENIAHILIPVDQLDNMSTQDIGQNVLNLLDEARYAQALDFSILILIDPGQEYWNKFEDELNELINVAMPYLDEFRHINCRIEDAAKFIENYLDEIERKKKKNKHMSKEKNKSSTQRDRNLILLGSKYGFQCFKCGSCYNLEIDHIIPLSEGGCTTLDNLQILCKSCNLEKRDSNHDYRDEINHVCQYVNK